VELSALTWYDLLGVLPGTSTQEISREYSSNSKLLGPAHLSGAPSQVIAAASRAQRTLDAAWRVLGDPATRRSYDESIGFRRSGDGLASPGSYASQPGLGDVGFVAGSPGAEALGFLMALTDWLAPHPHPSRRLAVPDVRGLFYSVGLELAGRIGLHLTPIRLTQNPMPVDGLIVDQRPQSPTKVRRDSELEVEVWHPPARPAN
jgi:curved DNA-binding protein CbpA